MEVIAHNSGQFHIRTKNTSYVFSVFRDKFLIHDYWGERLENDIDFSHKPYDIYAGRATAFYTPIDAEDKFFSSDLKLEFGISSRGDYRVPTYLAKYSDGSTVSGFRFEKFEMINGKRKICGLPAVYTESDSEAETVEISFTDELQKVRLVLSYTAMYDFDVITRNMRVENFGKNTVTLLSVQSCCVDFPGMDYKLLHLHGDWLRERSPEYVNISHGIYTVDSKRGMSSHANNPFVALCSKDLTEYSGEVYGFSLVYSGSFAAEAEGTPTGSTRVTMGINSFDFEYPVKGGAVFYAPEVVLAYSNCGLMNMSRKYHEVYKKRLVRGFYRDKVRPIVANSWDAIEMDYDEEKLLAIAKKAAEAECELFVLDDGWFDGRFNDKTSVGDWTADKTKIPSGLDGICRKINKLGLDMGIWFDPEMVTPISKLYEKHPDWCLNAPGRSRTLNRNQLMLDLTRKEVRDYIYNSISSVLDTTNIKYIKWDCNRNLSEMQSPSKSYDYVLGLYELLERLTADYPEILFESCSGGGGRFDPGMLYYMPQVWTSDNVRVRGRIDIQYGTSIVYPLSTMCAHVGKINLNAEKDDKYMHANAVVSLGCLFGYEFDMSKMNDNVREQSVRYSRIYKSIRSHVMNGTMYRIENPFEKNAASWEIVDGGTALLFFCQKEFAGNGEERIIKLHGLENNAVYECGGKKYFGEELMKSGISLPLSEYENESDLFIFKKISDEGE